MLPVLGVGDSDCAVVESSDDDVDDSVDSVVSVDDSDVDEDDSGNANKCKW